MIRLRRRVCQCDKCSWLSLTDRTAMLHGGGLIAPDVSLELSLPDGKGTANGWRVRKRAERSGERWRRAVDASLRIGIEICQANDCARERTLCLPDAPARRTGTSNLFLPHCNTRTECYELSQLVVRIRETRFRSSCTQLQPLSDWPRSNE